MFVGCWLDVVGRLDVCLSDFFFHSQRLGRSERDAAWLWRHLTDSQGACKACWEDLVNRGMMGCEGLPSLEG
jgi:hypothetical protein